MERVKKVIFLDDESVIKALESSNRRVSLLCQIAVKELIEKYGLHDASPAQMKKFFEFYDFMKASKNIPSVSSIFASENFTSEIPKTIKEVEVNEKSVVDMSDKEKMASIMEAW